MIRSSAAKTATRSRFQSWLEKMRTDPSRQYGLQQAGINILSGDTVNDPWGSLAKGIVGYAQGKRESEERERILALEAEDRSRRQAQEDAKLARDNQQFEMTKKLTEAQLADAQAKREFAEQGRQALIKILPTLPPEDRVLLEPYAADLDKFAAVYDDLQDNRRQQSQFDVTLAETKRRNSVDERHDSARLGLEKRRVDIAEEAAKFKGEKETIKRIGNFMITQDALGREIARETLPDNPRDRRNAALRIMEARGSDPKETAALLAELDAELGPAPLPAGIGPVVTHRQNTAPESDEELLAAIGAAKAEGESDAAILAAVEDPALKARVAALLRRR